MYIYTKKVRPQSRDSREIFGETETRKRVSRQDQSRGLESRLQALMGTYVDQPKYICEWVSMASRITYFQKISPLIFFTFLGD